jgi:hypothetical protein
VKTTVSARALCRKQFFCLIIPAAPGVNRVVSMYEDESVRQLRDDERWAQLCIQHSMPDCTVEPHDDGSRSSMYDLKIIYPDGSIGAVEVTAAADGERIGLWREVRKRGLICQEPDLVGGWRVSILRSARASDLDRHLTGLLRLLERSRRTAVRAVKGSADPFEARASDLGLIEAVQSPTDRKGSIYIMPPQESPEPMGGYAQLTGDPLAVWLGDWANEPSQADNASKLRRAEAADRHLFIVVRSFNNAPFAVIDLLISSGAPMPTKPPALPAEMTDVWVMSDWDSGDGFRWSQDTGWARFAKLAPPSA